MMLLWFVFMSSLACKPLAFIYVRRSYKVLGAIWVKEGVWDWVCRKSYEFPHSQQKIALSWLNKIMSNVYFTVD